MGLIVPIDTGTTENTSVDDGFRENSNKIGKLLKHLDPAINMHSVGEECKRSVQILLSYLVNLNLPENARIADLKDKLENMFTTIITRVHAVDPNEQQKCYMQLLSILFTLRKVHKHPIQG